MHPFLRENITAEPLLTSEHSSDFCPVCWEESEDVGTLAFQRRVESLAKEYLDGSPIFILSASLEGPFDENWKNPWSSNSSAPLCSVCCRRRKDESSAHEIVTSASSEVTDPTSVPSPTPSLSRQESGSPIQLQTEVDITKQLSSDSYLDVGQRPVECVEQHVSVVSHSPGIAAHEFHLESARSTRDGRLEIATPRQPGILPEVSLNTSQLTHCTALKNVQRSCPHTRIINRMFNGSIEKALFERLAENMPEVMELMGSEKMCPPHWIIDRAAFKAAETSFYTAKSDDSAESQKDHGKGEKGRRDSEYDGTAGSRTKAQKATSKSEGVVERNITSTETTQSCGGVARSKVVKLSYAKKMKTAESNSAGYVLQEAGDSDFTTFRRESGVKSRSEEFVGKPESLAPQEPAVHVDLNIEKSEDHQDAQSPLESVILISPEVLNSIGTIEDAKAQEAAAISAPEDAFAGSRDNSIYGEEENKLERRVTATDVDKSRGGIGTWTTRICDQHIPNTEPAGTVFRRDVQRPGLDAWSCDIRDIQSNPFSKGGTPDLDAIEAFAMGVLGSSSPDY